jgi:hypothetical protein
MRLNKIVMFPLGFSLMRSAIIGIFLLSSSFAGFAQNGHFENYDLQPVKVNMSIANIDGKKAVRVFRDTSTQGADIPTFVRLINTDDAIFRDIKVMAEN